jgi:hypothetical protein
MSADPLEDFYDLGDPTSQGAFRARFIGSEDCGARFTRGEASPAETLARLGVPRPGQPENPA